VPHGRIETDRIVTARAVQFDLWGGATPIEEPPQPPPREMIAESIPDIDPFDVDDPANQIEIPICGVTEANAFTVRPRELWPPEIALRSVSIPTAVKFQRRISRAIWRPCPGRNMAFIVEAGRDPIGLLYLASDVPNLGARDQHLGLSKDGKERGTQLRQYMNMSVCVGVQPIAWHWNLGKLVAMIAPTLGPEFRERYGDELLGIVTTSLFGRSSQYNRIYKLIGYTKGYGHEHISRNVYRAMIARMHRENVTRKIRGVNSSDSNTRMLHCRQYAKHFNDPRAEPFHGKIRGVYYHPVVTHSTRDAIDHWYERWGRPRWDRTRDQTAPYQDGLNGNKEFTMTGGEP